MKNTVLFFLSFIFVVQASVKTVMLVHWKINQQQITELYCINKDNPMMHCEGKCYLSRQLQKIEADYQSSKLPPDMKHWKAAEFVLYAGDLLTTPALFITASSVEQPKGGIYSSHLLPGVAAAVFHPPIIS